MTDRQIPITAYPRLSGETDDSPRIARAVADNPGGTILFPRAEYALSAPVQVTGGSKLAFHKSARVYPIREMETLFAFSGGGEIAGGVIDAAGMADCVTFDGDGDGVVSDLVLRNGRSAFLRASAGGTLTAVNLYIHTTMHGLAGNVGVMTGRKSALTDIIIVDATVGVEVFGGRGSLLTRCHIWGGIVSAREEGGIREMLENSVCFHIHPEAKDTTLVDSYADSGAIGFLIDGNTTLKGCSYYNNYESFRLDNIVCILHRAGHLVVEDGYFSRTAPHTEFYRGTGDMELLDPMGRGGIDLEGGIA